MDLIEKLDREIETRRKKLEALEAYAPTEVPYRYVIDFKDRFQTINPALSRPAQESVRSFVVRKDTKFYVKAIEVAYTAIGTAQAAPTSIFVTLPGNIRPSVFDFQWKIRDTGSDREWQNDWLPSRILLSGNKTGIQFQRGHAFLSGGSEVYVTMGPTFHLNNVNLTQLSSISEYTLQFSFVGVEVKA